MKHKILVKLLAAFGAIMLLFSVVLGGVFLTLFREHTLKINRTAMERQAVSIADTLAAFQQNPMGGYGAYLRFLDKLTLGDVWIVDQSLQITTCGSQKCAVRYDDLPSNAEQIVSRVFSGEKTYGAEFSGLLGVDALTVGVPIYREGAVVGAVLLHAPASGVNDAVRQGMLTLVAGCAAALLSAGIAAFLLSYRFTRPLERMKTTALELSSGNYQVKTDVRSADEFGQLAGVLDILAQRLQTLEEERAALDRSRERFVADVSHEMRTPIAVLRGSLELLQDGTVSRPEAVAEYYGQMLRESRHLERLVNDLLELSRLQDAGFQLQMKEVNLRDVVSDATRAIRPAAQAKGLTVQAALPETECLLSGDYGRLRQLLFILLDNAVKFSHADTVIQVSLERSPGLTLTVTDCGAVIPPEDLPHIFDRFYKSNARENAGGTGLGLAIASEIAKRHDAVISAVSDAERTAFQVAFSPCSAPA